ncbi:MAG: hypothetical protein J0G36_22030 [Afipia sp.]|nr:hypothetical protein [Afipia sp.]
MRVFFIAAIGVTAPRARDKARRLANCVALLLAAPGLAFASSAAYSLPSNDLNFLCIPEAAGGVSFNENTKRWESTKFRLKRGLVVKLKHLRTFSEKNTFGRSETFTEFRIRMTEVGEKDEYRCYHASKHTDEVTIGETDFLTCSGSDLTERQQ